jgi:transcriptional regulator with XRE-family HTH domain
MIILFTFVIAYLFSMRDRIIEFLRSENKSSAQLAEEIGVQPSGISHIISGRNNPSLDFVVKMLEKYKYLSTEWLLFGKGEMYKENQAKLLFDDTVHLKSEKDSHTSDSSDNDYNIEIQDIDSKNAGTQTVLNSLSSSNKVVKIVWFYDNNSFEEYYPRS